MSRLNPPRYCLKREYVPSDDSFSEDDISSDTDDSFLAEKKQQPKVSQGNVIQRRNKIFKTLPPEHYQLRKSLIARAWGGQTEPSNQVLICSTPRHRGSLKIVDSSLRLSPIIKVVNNEKQLVPDSNNKNVLRRSRSVEGPRLQKIANEDSISKNGQKTKSHALKPINGITSKILRSNSNISLQELVKEKDTEISSTSKKLKGVYKENDKIDNFVVQNGSLSKRLQSASTSQKEKSKIEKNRSATVDKNSSKLETKTSKVVKDNTADLNGVRTNSTNISKTAEVSKRQVNKSRSDNSLIPVENIAKKSQNINGTKESEHISNNNDKNKTPKNSKNVQDKSKAGNKLNNSKGKTVNNVRDVSISCNDAEPVISTSFHKNGADLDNYDDQQIPTEAVIQLNFQNDLENPHNSILRNRTVQETTKIQTSYSLRRSVSFNAVSARKKNRNSYKSHTETPVRSVPHQNQTNNEIYTAINKSGLQKSLDKTASLNQKNVSKGTSMTPEIICIDDDSIINNSVTSAATHRNNKTHTRATQCITTNTFYRSLREIETQTSDSLTKSPIVRLLKTNIDIRSALATASDDRSVKRKLSKEDCTQQIENDSNIKKSRISASAAPLQDSNYQQAVPEMVNISKTRSFSQQAKSNATKQATVDHIVMESVNCNEITSTREVSLNRKNNSKEQSNTTQNISLEVSTNKMSPAEINQELQNKNTSSSKRSSTKARGSVSLNINNNLKQQLPEKPKTANNQNKNVLVEQITVRSSTDNEIVIENNRSKRQSNKRFDKRGSSISSVSIQEKGSEPLPSSSIKKQNNKQNVAAGIKDLVLSPRNNVFGTGHCEILKNINEYIEDCAESLDEDIPLFTKRKLTLSTNIRKILDRNANIKIISKVNEDHKNQNRKNVRKDKSLAPPKSQNVTKAAKKTAGGAQIHSRRESAQNNAVALEARYYKTYGNNFADYRWLPPQNVVHVPDNLPTEDTTGLRRSTRIRKQPTTLYLAAMFDTNIVKLNPKPAAKPRTRNNKKTKSTKVDSSNNTDTITSTTHCSNQTNDQRCSTSTQASRIHTISDRSIDNQSTASQHRYNTRHQSAIQLLSDQTVTNQSASNHENNVTFRRPLSPNKASSKTQSKENLAKPSSPNKNKYNSVARNIFKQKTADGSENNSGHQDACDSGVGSTVRDSHSNLGQLPILHSNRISQLSSSPGHNFISQENVTVIHTPRPQTGKDNNTIENVNTTNKKSLTEQQSVHRDSVNTTYNESKRSSTLAQGSGAIVKKKPQEFKKRISKIIAKGNTGSPATRNSYVTDVQTMNSAMSNQIEVSGGHGSGLQSIRIAEEAVSKIHPEREGHYEDFVIDNEVRRTQCFVKAPILRRNRKLPNMSVGYGMKNYNGFCSVVTGFLHLAAGTGKAESCPRNHCIYFKVEEGSALVKLNKSIIEVTHHDTFFVSVGADYYIHNMSPEDDLLLSFVKCSKYEV